jgi:hypothetical protein
MPVPLPAVTPSELPGGWIAPLTAAPCPAPLRARLRIRVEAEGAPGLTVDGSLSAHVPGTMRLQARLGPFRPIFALSAGPDSCELLLHQTGRYWVVPRRSPDWARMDPAAWTQALEWGLCAAELFRNLEPDGAGLIDHGIWELTGKLKGTSQGFRLRLDPRRSALRELQILDSLGTTILDAGLSRWVRFGDVWLPQILDLRFPAGGLRLRAELLGLTSVSAADIGAPRMTRPAGWRPLAPGDLTPSFAVP